MMVRKYERVFVDPEFKKKLKVKAALENTTMMKLTKELANNEELFKPTKIKKKEKPFKMF